MCKVANLVVSHIMQQWWKARLLVVVYVKCVTKRNLFEVQRSLLVCKNRKTIFQFRGFSCFEPKETNIPIFKKPIEMIILQRYSMNVLQRSLKTKGIINFRSPLYLKCRIKVSSSWNRYKYAGTFSFSTQSFQMGVQIQVCLKKNWYILFLNNGSPEIKYLSGQPTQ